MAYDDLNTDPEKIAKLGPWARERVAPYSPPADGGVYSPQYQTQQQDQQDLSFDAFSAASNYDQLGHVERAAAWNKYRSEVLPKLAAQHGRDLSAMQAAFDKAVPRPQVPKRSGADFLTDPLVGLAAGVTGLAKSASDFIDPSSSASQYLGDAVEGIKKNYSAVEKDAELQRQADQRRIDADTNMGGIQKFGAEAASAFKHMSIGQLAELVGNILPTIGLTLGVGAGAKALQLGSKGVQAATAGAGAVTGAVGSGGDAAGSAYEAVMNMPAEKLSQAPGYQELVARLGETEAKKTLAMSAARTAQIPGTALGAFFGPLGAEAALGKKLAGKEAGGRFATAGKEAVFSEIPEEVGTTMSGNYGTQQVDPSQRLMQGAGQAAALAAIGGGGAGFIAGGGGKPQQSLEDQLMTGEAPATDPMGGTPAIGYDRPSGQIGMTPGVLSGGTGALSGAGTPGFNPEEAITMAASMGGRIGGRVAEVNLRFLDSAWRTGGEEAVRELAQQTNTVGLAAREFIKALEASRVPKQLEGPAPTLALPSPESDSGVLMAGADGIRSASNREMQDRRAQSAEIWRQQQETGLTNDVIQAQAARAASQEAEGGKAAKDYAGAVSGSGAEAGAGAGELGNVGADGQALKHVVLQNRDREGAASIAQMQQIASNPDYNRVSISRQLGEGSPVVIDEVNLPDAQRGREEVAVDGQGRSIRTRYAVVEATDLLASHTADGQAVKGYERGEGGKLRAVAGNGRVAGIQRAYTNGKAMDYRTSMQFDQLHGVDPQVIAGMKAPVLVRTMSPVDVTADIGDRTNTTGVSQLSPVEQAKNDARRVHVAGLEFDDNGDPTPDSVRRFVQGMPESERGNLMDAGGQYGRQAVDRLMAAVFWKAYGDADLVQLYAQATDPEAKTVLNALADAAGPMAQLEGTAVDIRDVVAEAAKAAVNARRKGLKLADFARTQDMTMTADTQAVVDFFAQNIRSAKRIGEGLRSAAQFALDNQGGSDMFGDVAPASRADVVNKLRGQDDTRTTQSDADAGRGGPAQVDVGRDGGADSANQQGPGGGAETDSGQGQEARPPAVTGDTPNQPAQAGFSLPENQEKDDGTQADQAQQTTPERQEAAAAGSAGNESAQSLSPEDLRERGRLVANFVQSIVDGADHPNSLRVGVISQNAGDRLSDAAQINARGAVEVVIADSVVHAGNRHPDLRLEDWARLPEVTNTFDEADVGRESRDKRMTRIVLRKRTGGDGSGYGAVYDFAAGGSRGRKKLNLVTYFWGTEKSLDAWWQKNKGADPAAVPNFPEPVLNTRDDVSAPSTQSLPQIPAKAQGPAMVALQKQKAKRDAEVGLTGPTPEQIRATEEAKAAAERADKAAKAADDARAKLEQERKEIAQRSEAAAETFELGQDPMANLTGQGDLLADKPSQPKTENKPQANADAAPQSPADDLDAMFDQALDAATGKPAGSLDDAINGLGALFGAGKGNTAKEDAATYGANGVDAATYRQAKPLFEQALANMTEKDTRKAMFAVVKLVVDKFGAEAAGKMKPYVVQFIGEYQKGNQDVPNTTGDLEQDSQKPATEPAMGDSVQSDTRSAAGSAGQDGGSTRRSGRGGQRNGTGDALGSTSSGGKRGDQRVRGGGTEPELADIVDGSDFGERGGDSGITGVPPESIPASEVNAAAQSPIQAAKNISAQKKAPTDVKLGDLDNIKATLPALLPGQQEDVQKAETRFTKPDGYGMLFTNGTGTGKTFTGLGIIKRFALQGKTNTLIIVPDEKIGNDWIKSGKVLGLDITRLDGTKDAGKGITITTYANLGENNELAKRQWDLVVPDEAHTLMQSADGTETGYLKALRAITYHPDGVGTRHAMLAADELTKVAELSEEIQGLGKILGTPDSTDMARDAARKRLDAAKKELEAVTKKSEEIREAVKADVKAKQGAERTRLAALSATPFAYVKTINWANGYLFDYNEGRASEEGSFRGYNEGSNKEQFFMQHFGYRMRYNKLTAPDAQVDSGMMERQFNTMLKRNGVLSGRMLDVPADYDRRFILVDSGIGNRIDEALSWLSDQANQKGDAGRPYREVSDLLRKKFDHLQRRYLLEAIKATEVVPIVRQHMAMGRKVVVFHDYKKGGTGGKNPFDLPLQFGGDSTGVNDAIKDFRAKFADLINAKLGNLDSPIEVFKREFPDVMLVNGDEKKGDLLGRYERFQDDSTGPLVMLVQSAKNKGWSGHDTTGKNQRVLINLGQPTAPTLAIQQEGRIYRTGQVSNAIMRYLNTGTGWERTTFASTIAARASTAENLGMGEQARALKDSFIMAFDESDTYAPGHEGEGTGGKQIDAAQNNALTEFDRAKSFYWAQQKKNSKTKAQEGKDYFATPEPVGLKMVQMLDARGGEDLLEPSAGHGAIARWMPANVNRTAVEPSTILRSRLMLAMNPTEDRILDGNFEDLHIGNKFDGIVMNPPFGVGGKVAMEHLAKAYGHLRPGGRIVALIPTGPAADKRFDAWYYGQDAKGNPTVPDIQIVAEIKLPTQTFERAGTGVMTRIVVLEKAVDPKTAAQISTRKIDLTNVQDTNELFNKMEALVVPGRAKPVEVEPQEAAKPAKAGKPSKAADADYTVDQGNYEFITYTTKAGKQLRGIIVKAASKDEAKKLDPYTWKMGDGYFVREKHVRPRGAGVSEDVATYGNDTEGFTSAPTVNENTGSYETDLFGNPLPTAAKRTGAAKPAAPRVRGDAQPAGVIQDTPAPAGEYLVKTTIGSEVNRKMGTDTVFTAKDLAVATSYLYKSAVERFDGVVTDKDGKILGVVGGFKGAVTQTAIYPGTVMGEAIRIPGAARIWFSHNHPSGKSALSRADVNLWNTFKTTFDGTGIEPMGLIAVGGDEFSYTGQALYAPPGKDGEQFAPIPQAKGEFTVPVMERALPIGRQSLPPAIATPSDAKSVAKTMFERAGRRPGMMMLNAQNVPIGWVPIGGLLRGNLRNTGGMNALFRAASESNMSAAILVHDGDLDAKVSNVGGGVTVGQNIGAALAMVDVRILDILKGRTETYSDGSKGLYFQSTAEQGDATSAGPVFRSDRTQATAPATGISAKEAQEAVNKTLAGLGLDGVVSVNVGNNPGVFGFTTAPGVMPSGGSSGGQIYVFTDNISDVTDVFNVVLHELFHMGLSQSVGQGEYIQTMLKFLADPAVRRYAERWKLSTDGQTRKGKMLANNWNALAVEEAMADIAEDMGTDRIGTKQKSEFVRNMIRILANLAQKLKMPGVARKLRQMTYTESEKFVQDMMARARDGAPVLSSSDALSSSRDAVGLAAATVTREASTFSEAREQAKTFQGKSLINKRTGMGAVVSRNTLDKMLSSKAVGKSESPASHSFAVANLDQLFERAILGWSKPDLAGDSNIAAIHRFFAPIMRDGRLQMVKMTVKETSQNDKANPLYTVETVEFNEKSPAAQWVGEIANADGIDPRTIRSAGEAQSLAEKIEAFNNDGMDFVWRSQRSTDEAMEFTMDGRADAESLVNLAKAKDAAGLKKQMDGKFTEFFRSLNDGFHDAMGPAKRWIEGLQAGDSAKRSLLSGLYRGAVQRDALQFDAKQKHGNKILEGISKIAKANGMDAETAQKLVGYWLTANYAPKANDWLVTKDRAALKVAKESGDDTAIAVAEQKIKDRLAAINDRNVRNVKRTVGVAGGLNNAQAALMKANIEKRIPADQIQAVAKEVYALLQWKKELDLKTGKVTPEQVKAWPGHADYVPLTGSPFVSLDEDVFGTGTNLPNVSKDKAIDGRTDSVADDGISAVWREVSKSATHAGFQDFKQALNGVYEDTLASNNGDKRATAEELGMTRSDSEYQASPGDDVVIYRSGGTSKVFRFADQAVIQAIKKGNVEETNKLIAMAGFPTRVFSQLATLWNVTFAPMNMTRDVWEKSELLRTRELVDGAGNALDTDVVARKMISLAFAPGVWKAAYRSVRGAADMSNPFDKALHELQINGGISTWGDHFAKKRGDLVGEVKDSTSKLAKVRGAVEAYNGVFEMVSSLASYMAMKEAGAATKEAAYQSLDLMNFRKQGALMGPLRPLYAFSQPIVTGGANLIGAMKTRKGQARFAAYVALGSLAYAALRGMADDDEAGNQLDNIGQFVLERSIPIPMGNGVLKIPVGFGMPQLAWAWAVNAVKTLAGEQSVGDAATELLVRNTVKVLSPIQPTEISASKDTGAFLASSVTPTVLKPLMQLAMDKTAFGAPIAPKFFNKEKFKSEQGREQTAEFYKDAADVIRELTGKDLFPEQAKVLIDGLAVGPLRTLLQVAVTNPNKERLGKNTDVPILSAFYQGMNESAVRTKFFAALDEATTLKQESNSEGGTDGMSEADKAKLKWYDDWKAESQKFTNRKAAITRKKMAPDEDRAAKADLAKEKEKAEAIYIARWRVIEGKTTKAPQGAF